jgi:hypothetical protein
MATSSKTASSSKAEKLAREARFVFTGTVKKLKAATLPEIKKADKERTVIVRVDEILQAPPIFSNRTGQEITMQLKKGEKVTVGQQAEFYTNSWLIGNEGVAVISLGHRLVQKATAAVLSAAAPADPAKSLAARDMQAHVDDADMVVTGVVKRVNLPDEEANTFTAAAGASGTPPLSEHDPGWQEAVVEIDSVHKGSHDKKSVTLRFPSSKDRMWADAPKFKPGQSGYFVLHKTPMGQDKQGKVAAMAAGSPEVQDEYYTALHGEDFQPFEHAGTLHEMFGAAEEPGEN